LAKCRKALPFTLEILNRQIAGYTLGEGVPVFLFHGWGGARTDMNTIAEGFAASERLAVVVDLPGHGSDRGSRTDLFVMASTIDAVCEVFGTPDVVVAHSFGALAAMTTFPHGGPRRVIFFAPALQSEKALRYFVAKVGLTSQAIGHFFERMDRFAGPKVSEILRGNGTIPGAEVLIFHDPMDNRTPYEDSVAYAETNPTADLIAVHGVGHLDILFDPGAIERAVAFGVDSEVELTS